MKDLQRIALPQPDFWTAEDREPAAAWTPPESHDEQAWQRRVREEMRPLVERCQRLRERGLLE